MKELFNYCELPSSHEPPELLCISAYLQKQGLNGIELMLYNNKAIPTNSLDKIVGVHLKYWPFWVDFWLDKKNHLANQFPNSKEQAAYFGNSNTKLEWLAHIKEHLLSAIKLNPEYLVWHVCNADYQEVFTWKFRYSDKEILDCTAELFNAVADVIPAGMLILFENLWWPGLRLTDKKLTDDFFNKIKHLNCGIMLDLGHLLNTNSTLKSEKFAYKYALDTIENLKETRTKIMGIHLSCSLSGEYVRSFERKFPNELPIFKHITQIDQHLPCQHSDLKKVIQLIQPKYLIHELYYSDFQELSKLIALQRKAFQ